MLENIVYLISLFICVFFGYKYRQYKQEWEDIRNDIKKINKSYNIDSMSDDDINKLYDKNE